MVILPTTAAVLVAFLTLLAYNHVQNRLANGRYRKKNLKLLTSRTILATNEVKSQHGNEFEAVNGLTLSAKGQGINQEVEALKLLYHKLHNLEYHPDILAESRQLLLSLLSSTLTEALSEPESGILSVRSFSCKVLDDFLKAKDADVTDKWEMYLRRRQAGGAREIFSTKEEAKWWLKQAAPVKYIDGAWLGHINKISTPFKYRHITKNAWQVLSEELGDGDLAKNHVRVYRELMADIEAGLPAADSLDFIHARHGLDEARCWKAALAQLTISLFPHDFLAESLGFNMAYESLPLHLLKTVKELRELRLNPYYFELHISIDNAASGHAAMAMSAVADYIDVVRKEEGEAAAHVAWKRVQAGYILAEGLPTTPESPSLKTSFSSPRNKLEASVLEIFAAKSPVAHKIHCNSRLKIGRRSLVDWLDPAAFKNQQWQSEFLQDLGSCQPWVIRGHSGASRLVQELSWQGKMFGSFTEKEVQSVKAWIDHLAPPTVPPGPPAPNVYLSFTGQLSNVLSPPAPHETNVLVDYPVLLSAASIPAFLNPARDEPGPYFHPQRIRLQDLLPLWFASCALLESLASVPVRASDAFGSALVRVLRAQTGFDIEGAGVAGMDEVRRTHNGQAIGIVELGLAMCRRAGLGERASLHEVMALGGTQSVVFSAWMLQASMRWLALGDVLVGMAWTFMEVHHAVAEYGGRGAVLDTGGRLVLKEIAARERAGLQLCVTELAGHSVREADFARGVSMAKAGIKTCMAV